MPSWRTAAIAAAALLAAVPATASAGKGGGHHGQHRHGHDDPGLWEVYDDALAGARYIDLTHDITPGIPVWKGFGPAVFSPTVEPDHRPALHVRPARLRGHGVPAGDRPVRDPARPARALGARVPGI